LLLSPSIILNDNNKQKRLYAKKESKKEIKRGYTLFVWILIDSVVVVLGLRFGLGDRFD
jgi:hypothetical protein